MSDREGGGKRGESTQSLFASASSKVRDFSPFCKGNQPRMGEGRAARTDMTQRSGGIDGNQHLFGGKGIANLQPTEKATRDVTLPDEVEEKSTTTTEDY